MEGKYIKFVAATVPTHVRTTLVDGEKIDEVIRSKMVWFVLTKRDGDELGTIDWFERWHRYSFYPKSGTIYDATCLRDLADFCVEQTRLYNIYKLRKGE